jgi:hypothetical protein
MRPITTVKFCGLKGLRRVSRAVQPAKKEGQSIRNAIRHVRETCDMNDTFKNLRAAAIGRRPPAVLHLLHIFVKLCTYLSILTTSRNYLIDLYIL